MFVVMPPWELGAISAHAWRWACASSGEKSRPCADDAANRVRHAQCPVPDYPGVDIEGRVLAFSRTFNYPRELVFVAFTKSDHLRKWWGPEPWGVSDSIMDFRPGGSWRYAMQGPDGTKSWGIMLYKEIDPPSRVVYEDAFADEDGNVSSELPTATGVWEFTENDDGTTHVKMTTEYADGQALKTVVEMGMLEGMNTALKQLEALLADMAE